MFGHEIVARTRAVQKQIVPSPPDRVDQSALPKFDDLDLIWTLAIFV
jgi:hypothetical protein